MHSAPKTSSRAADRIPFHVQPMLATLVAEPFARSGWVFEEKYDGDRILAYKEGNQVRLLSRNGIDRSDRFPRIAAIVAALSPRTLLLDGEVVTLDSKGVSLRATRGTFSLQRQHMEVIAAVRG